MNMPQGYKQTELGMIPEDWDVKKICDGLANVKSGKRLPYGYYVTENRTNHPYIRVIDMYDGGIDTSNLMFVPDEAYKPIEKYRIFKEDIFISVAGTLGIVGKIPEWLDGANLTENANRLTDITCDRDYLLYYLRSPYIQNVISSEQTIGAQPKLALTRIRNFDIALPNDVSEQQAIAEALSDVDDLIAALDKKIAKKRLLKQGAMQQLLTGKKRLPGFTDEWVEKKLGDISCIKTGKRNGDEAIENGKYPFFVRSQKVYTIDSYSYEGEAILVPGEGGIGNIFHYINGKFDYHQRVYKISDFANNTCGKYIFFYMSRYFGEYALSLTVKATVDSLRLPTFEEFVIYMPLDVEEQKAIATILSDMDKDILDLETKRDKYRLLKSGMMQKLLTGQIRLKTL